LLARERLEGPKAYICTQREIFKYIVLDLRTLFLKNHVTTFWY